MSKLYTGVGSRKTPTEVLILMTAISKKLDARGYQLRSGGAQGADTAFAQGSRNKAIYRPTDVLPAWARVEAEQYCLECPLSRMQPGIQNLIIRNMLQVLGPKGNQPSEFLICWVPTLEYAGPDAGGTRYATRCADKHGVKVINLFDQSKQADWQRWVNA